MFRRTLRGVGALVALLVTCLALLVGVTPPAQATAAVPSSVQTLVEDGVVVDDTQPDLPDESSLGAPPDALFVVTPGTGDNTLRPRIDEMTGNRTTLIVQYDEAFWPIVSGKSGALLPLFAPTFDKSKEQAIQANLAVMRALAGDTSIPVVVYNGYSQGAAALGNAAEIAYAEGLLGLRDTVYLTSDPRGPWGIMDRLQKLPLLPQAMKLIGVTPEGARDPAKTGDVNVIQVIVTADPVANWQWKRHRPGSSLVVNLVGFIVCHSVAGCYGDPNQHGTPVMYRSVDGNTTYLVYKSLHPFVLARKAFYDRVGLKYTAADLAKWDAQANAFYEISQPTPENAAVPVTEVPAPVARTATAQPVVSQPVEPEAPVEDEPTYEEPSSGELDTSSSDETLEPAAQPVESQLPSSPEPEEVSEPEAETVDSDSDSTPDSDTDSTSSDQTGSVDSGDSSSESTSSSEESSSADD